MTPILAAAIVAAQLADAATWTHLPAGAERNPLIAGWHSEQGWAVRLALLALIFSAVLVARYAPAPRYAFEVPLLRGVIEVMAVAAIAAGFLGAGSNVAVLLAVR